MVDYEALKQQVDAPPINGFGMDTLTNALKTPKGPEQALNPSDDIAGLVKGNIKGTQDLVSNYKKEAAPVRQEYDKALSTPHPETPKYQDVLNYQDLQKSLAEGKKNAQDWASVVGVVSALIGGVAKKHGLAGLSALKGGIQGISEGNDKSAKEQMDLFKESNEAIQKHNEMLKNAYNDILSDRKLNQDDLKAKLTEKSLEFGDLIAAQNAMKGDISAFIGFQKERDKEVQKLGFTADAAYESARKVSEAEGYRGEKFIDFMKSHSPGAADVMDKVKLIGDYDLRGVSAIGQSKDDPKTDAILAMVKRYNPNWSQRQWDSLDTFAKRGASTAASAAMANKYQSIDQTFNHIVEARDRINELGTGSLKGLNQLANMSSEQIQNNPRSNALYQYKTVAEQLVNEYTKALAGQGGGTLEDREVKRKLLDEDSSTQTINKTLDEMQRVISATKDATDVQVDRLMSGDPNAPVVGEKTATTLSNIKKEDAVDSMPLNAPAPSPSADPLGLR